MIDWDSFSWEAFATIVTGLAAVAGAVYVGRKQVGISDRQSRILEHQVELDALRLKSELFERRFEVYEATSRYLGLILAFVQRPEKEAEQRFLAAMDAARFLFAPDVHDQLRAIYNETNHLLATVATMEGNNKRTGGYREKDIERHSRQISKVSERFESLSSVFGDELRLSASARTTELGETR